MQIFQILFYEPTFNLLMFFYDIVQNLGIAILIVAVVSRLITWPLTRRQLKQAESGKEFQREVEKIKKKYNKNQEKQAQELAKIQAKYLPGQLGGCLNLIIALILLIQVRNVIINLVTEGVHAFNQVAYTEGLMLPEDSITTDLSDLGVGIHEIEYEVVAGENQLNKKYIFAVVDDESRVELTTELTSKIASETAEQRHEREESVRRSNIGLFIQELKQFGTEDPIVIEDPSSVTAFMRPPSRIPINYEDTRVILNGEVIPEDELEISKGEPLNFTFLGADLSKVATDFGFEDVRTVLPYVVIAVSVGITQFFASRVQMGLNPAMTTTSPKKDDKKKKKGKKEEPEQVSFSEVLAQSSKQMAFIFPAVTVVWSLGFFGAFFPTGVSLFWTGQNGFVIIQELITNRKKAKEKFSDLSSKVLKSGEDKENKNNNGKNRRKKNN